ncbi:tRNA lysidine(34) synthetase TilS [Gymnodinialimonas sp. 2305UL16-5]|uniref:tRNA lysidine(34) synthetase TilS n=1 Tax=Gymnodinialimonas mytili TaxID=3126503 RepID=UPI0030B55382
MPVSDTLPGRFAGQMGQLLGPDFPTAIGLAVSGGGDSMAMLALTHEWARIYGVTLRVATVDHGLRTESAAEAQMVARECADLGHAHDILHWQWNGQGNLQDAARRARLDLIAQWRGDLDHVLFAHTRDDQAETVLMRLLRGSGVEGLSAMAPMREMGGWQVLRPLLQETRADLRHHVTTLRVPFVDDPSNEDDTYERVRTRRAISDLDLDAASLAETAARMGRAREALTARAISVAGEVVYQDTYGGRPTGDLIFDRDGLVQIERDTQLRLLAAALQWVSNAEYRPRARALEALLDRALAGGGGTLHGARVIMGGATLRICREYAAVADLAVPLKTPAIWDRRWWIETDRVDDHILRALGADGWQQLTDRPSDAPPYEAAIATPALFDGAHLVASALFTTSPQLTATLRPRRGTFVASLKSR